MNTWLDRSLTHRAMAISCAKRFYSLADGGMVGVGIGNGLAENIPVVESDFIFAAIAEETGLLGGAAVLLLYLSLCIRGFATAARAKSDVSAMMAVGCTVTIVLQAFIIVGGVTRLIPLTGLTLPFISQGGSSLLAKFHWHWPFAAMRRRGHRHQLGSSRRNEPHGPHWRARLARPPRRNGVLGRVALGKRLTNTALAFAHVRGACSELTYVMVIMADEYQSYPATTTRSIRKRAPNAAHLHIRWRRVGRQRAGRRWRIRARISVGSLAAHLVGYYSQVYGASGIEASQNNALKGDSNFASWTDVVNSMAESRRPATTCASRSIPRFRKPPNRCSRGLQGRRRS